MNAATAPNNRRAFSLAFGLYLLWVFATWFLEGRILTFQRPEDITTFGIATTLALYAALRPINGSLMAIATVLGLVEAIAFILARPAFEMLYLSSQYAAATTEAQRAMFLAAGEAMVAALNGTAFHLSISLFSIYFLIISIVMVQSRIFGRVTTYMGNLAALFNWVLYVLEIGIFLSILSTRIIHEAEFG